MCYQFQHFLAVDFISSQFKNRGKKCKYFSNLKTVFIFPVKNTKMDFSPNFSFPKCLSNSLCKHISAYGLFINSSISFFTKVRNLLFIYLLTYL